jgi:hypothetical protein
MLGTADEIGRASVDFRGPLAAFYADTYLAPD